MWMNLKKMVIFQISTFQRSIFALFGRVFKILIILMSNLSPKYPPN